VPDTLYVVIPILIGLGLIASTCIVIFSDPILFNLFNQNIYFLGTVVAIWFGIIWLSVFGPLMWEANRISKMNVSEFERLIQKRSYRMLNVKRNWDQVNNVVLKGSQAQFLFESENRKITAELKQVYSQEISSVPPQLQLRDFLMEKLGARLQVVG
jgi:hypothetical protein